MPDFILFVQRKHIVQSGFLMWVHLCGLHTLLSGNFLIFQWINALMVCLKCRKKSKRKAVLKERFIVSLSWRRNKDCGCMD